MKRFFFCIFVFLNFQTAFAAEISDRPPQLYVPFSPGEGITIAGALTSYMRFPHLLTYLFKQEFSQKHKDRRTVYIMGPGIMGPDLSEGTIPQLHELMTLFSCAGVMFDDVFVVDISKDILDAIPKSRYDRELGLCIFNDEINFEKITNQLFPQDENFSDLKFLKGLVDSIEPVLPEGIRTIKSDFALLDLKAESIDLMIATYSFQYALEQIHKQHGRPSLGLQAFAQKIFDSLKLGGILYMNRKTGMSMKEDYVGEAEFEITEIPSYTNYELMGLLHLKFRAANEKKSGAIATVHLVAIKRIK